MQYRRLLLLSLSMMLGGCISFVDIPKITNQTQIQSGSTIFASSLNSLSGIVDELASQGRESCGDEQDVLESCFAVRADTLYLKQADVSSGIVIDDGEVSHTLTFASGVLTYQNHRSVTLPVEVLGLTVHFDSNNRLIKQVSVLFPGFDIALAPQQFMIVDTPECLLYDDEHFDAMYYQLLKQQHRFALDALIIDDKLVPVSYEHLYYGDPAPELFNGIQARTCIRQVDTEYALSTLLMEKELIDKIFESFVLLPRP